VAPGGGEIGLELQNVSIRDPKENVFRLRDVNLQVRKGEILGIAGVSGNGQGDLCDAISGYRSGSHGLVAGRVLLNGEDITALSVRQRLRRGIGYVPADRHRYGLILSMRLTENMLLKRSFDAHWVKHGLIDRRALAAYTDAKIRAYAIKATGPDAVARSLSGGNQQKALLAREVDLGSSVIVFDQPTRGLDLGAIENVHRTILDEKKKGKAIVLISTELSEIFGLCDRIAILYKGEILGVYHNHELDTEKIGLLMAGYAPAQEMTV
jgi:simple sugar transport system ATP-binding protein